MNDQGPNDLPPAGKAEREHKVVVALAALAVALLVTWAIATFFGIALVKAFAGLVLVLFVVALAMLVTGVG